MYYRTPYEQARNDVSYVCLHRSFLPLGYNHHLEYDTDMNSFMISQLASHVWARASSRLLRGFYSYDYMHCSTSIAARVGWPPILMAKMGTIRL